MVKIINSIRTDSISNINYYQQNQKRNISADKNKCAGKSSVDYVMSDEVERFNIYFKEFRNSIKNGFLDTDKELENLSYKYKELFDEINKDKSNENEQIEKLESLNKVFKMMTDMVVSNQAFIAKSNEIHDYLVADLHKDIIKNPNKEEQNNILKNHEKTVETLNQLEKSLLTYANVYYESFINDIKNNPVDESIYTSLTNMKTYNLLSTNYYDTKNAIDNIYGKMKGI